MNASSRPTARAGSLAIPPDDPRGNLVVIGGGCYGSYHARQLDRARSRGRIDTRGIVIVDRDPDCAARREFAGRPGFEYLTATWDDFYDAYFEARGLGTRDQIIPTPVAAHLMFEWLKRRASARMGPEARVTTGTFDRLPDTPCALQTDAGAGILSFATWVCPVTCVEPRICPHTRGIKDWEMDDAVFAYARREAGRGRIFDLVEVFRCHHFAFGISTFPTALAVAARRRLDHLTDRLRRRWQKGEATTRQVLVATTSSCHGIVNRMEIAPGL